MCGRFTLRAPAATVAKEFGLLDVPELSPHFNISPSQSVAIVRQKPEAKGRELAFVHWGLIPSWAEDPKIGNRMANARSETAATKPSFRSAFKSRRCLIIADGFYEWQKTVGGKQPYLISMKDGRPFGMAGLWERWEKGEGRRASRVLCDPHHGGQRTDGTDSRANAGHPLAQAIRPLARSEVQ